MVRKLGNNSNSDRIHDNKSDCRCSGATYNRFFRRARLKVEHNDHEPTVFEPAHTYNQDTQKYLRVRIRNRGHQTAHHCVAQLRVIIPNDANPMRYPSNDPKVLTWGRSADKTDLSGNVDIPMIGEWILHIVFSDSRFEQWQPNAPMRFASVSMKPRLENYSPRVEDMFSDGYFVVELVVTSDETHCRELFRIKSTDII